MSDLHGIVIGFDIDGTLLDPGGSAYRQTTRELLAAGDLGLKDEEAWDAYESIRLWGRAMDRLGLANANHFRVHAEPLASLFLLFAGESRVSRSSRLSVHIRDVIRESLSKLNEALPDRGETDWRRRLAAERTTRALLKFDVSLGMFRDEVRRVAALPFISQWANCGTEIEAGAPLHDPRPLLDSLTARGANVVVISEGLSEVQQIKLSRLGLRERFAERTLITQDAGEIPGLRELDHTLEPFLDSPDDALDPRQQGELTALWRFRCIAHLWSTKSPWFFGRCLHALRASATAPAAAMKELAVAPRDCWRTDPLRLVMIGDRYDRDVAPLLAVAGADACTTIRLRFGRYAGEFPEVAMSSDRRPSHTVNDWRSLTHFLTNDLRHGDVPAMISMPRIADSSILDADLVGTGRDSPHEAVRNIASAVWRTLE